MNNTLRKTKIIATLGPSSSDKETIEKLIEAGMNVARLNFSHGYHSTHQEKIDILHEIRKKRNRPLAIMLDTKGPEFRIDRFKNKFVDLKKGDKFTFTTDKVEGNESIVGVNYNNLPSELEAGDTVLANDGLISFTVESIEGNKIHTVVNEGGRLSNRKSLNFPGKHLNIDYLSETDKQDILFGIKNKVDYIACSFVSCAQDLIDVCNFLTEHKARNIKLIAKIENQAGIDNLEEISKYCCAFMVARGDLGVEVPFDMIPTIQKDIIKECKRLGKNVITATELLESMIEKPRPTRAECTDVANAVFDGTGAVMLSGETAAGKYPVQAVETMAKICLASEKLNQYSTNQVHRPHLDESAISDAVAHAACAMAKDTKASAIICFTDGGYVPTMISLFKSNVDVLAITRDEKTYNQLALVWGCHGFYKAKLKDLEHMLESAREVAKTYLDLQKGDKIVLCSGYSIEGSIYENFIRVKEIK